MEAVIASARSRGLANEVAIAAVKSRLMNWNSILK